MEPTKINQGINPIANFVIETSTQGSFDGFYVPNDIMRIIFTYARGDIFTLQQVNKKWRQLANDWQLYKMMMAASAISIIDKRCWEKYVGDPGNEPKRPLFIFKEIEKGGGLLTLIPKTVKIKRIEKVNEEVVVSKEIIEEVRVNPKTMGELAANPKGGGHKTQYDPDAWRPAIDEQREEEESHWVYIRYEPIGRNATFQKQQEIARAQNHSKILDVSSQNKIQKASSQIIEGRADVASFNDFIVTAFMEKIHFGKSSFELESPGKERTWIRFNEQTQGKRIGAAFVSRGIAIVIDYNNRWPHIAVVVARKFFGLC